MALSNGPEFSSLYCVRNILQAATGLQAAHAVGNYALQIDFNDGHATGIFSFDFLRTICPCQDCAREYRSNPDL